VPVERAGEIWRILPVGLLRALKVIVAILNLMRASSEVPSEWRDYRLPVTTRASVRGKALKLDFYRPVVSEAEHTVPDVLCVIRTPGKLRKNFIYRMLYTDIY